MVYTNYHRGRNFEYRVKKYLEEKGYFVVRSAGSHGIFDLIAIEKLDYGVSYDNFVYGIQCRVDGKVKKEEIEEMKKIYENFGIIPIIAFRDGKKLAFKNVYFNVLVEM